MRATLVAGGLLLPGLTVLLGGLAAPAASAASAGNQNAVLAFGSASSTVANQAGLAGPVTGIASTPDGNGYWVTAANGQVTAEGDARNFGSMTGSLNAPIIGIAATTTGGGYWLVGGDGGIFSFGDARFFGSTGSLVLNKPVVGMASTSDGGGYWLVASDGGIFSFGDAAFHGSMGGTRLNEPVVGMAPTPSGGGYWLVASDGGIFSFGDANFQGSMGSIRLAQPVVGMSATPDGGGYRMVAADGGIFDFGDATFYGSGAGTPLTAPVVGMAARSGGYWIAYGSTDPLNTILGQEEVLAGLDYLPLTWSPLGFQWRWSPPATLAGQWVPGQNNAMARGAIMAFESVSGLPTDGAISTAEINALQAAADNPAADGNPNGYSYAVANETNPESVTVWHNGAVVEVTSANTGGAGTPTAQGTFPVYLRLRNQVMRGTNPNGSTYADPVQFVAYFNGGDALHYMPRTSYGDPQSLGCVELPLAGASIIWPYMTIGSLVTVD
ncbi:MAG TPA: L,D-transpeptidase [Acidimicrobiales bacterium]|nr:L,D-transpeptidase [Acidimicrobiales bacterium]